MVMGYYEREEMLISEFSDIFEREKEEINNLNCSNSMYSE